MQGGSGKSRKQQQKDTFSDIARALLEAPDRVKNDKVYRSQTFKMLLCSLYLYEYYPSDVVVRLLPCLDICSKHMDLLRSLLYVVMNNVCRGHAGTPTLLNHSGTTFAPDAQALKAEVDCCAALATQRGLNPSIKRYALYTVAASVRQHASMQDVFQKCLVDSIKMVDDEAAAKRPENEEPASATDWDLQHSVYCSLRISGVSAANHPIAAACFLGVMSPDPVGARHALALAEEIALKSPHVVRKELEGYIDSVMQVYSDKGPGACVPPECGMNISDTLARVHLARMCAYLINSDQGSLDPTSQAGMPFWNLLQILISHDESDTVRFAALHALSGNVVSQSESVLGPTRMGKSREDAVFQQRRARAWRTLGAQATSEISMKTSNGGQPVHVTLADLIGRLILLALSKPVKKARFTVAASVVTSLAKSCLAFNISGGTNTKSFPELDRMMNILAKEMGNLVESPISGGQRAACIEALLYLQAAGFPVSLSAASFTMVGADGGSGGAQDSLLVAVLHCARSCPGNAPLFLEYASGVVGIAPEAIDLKKVVALWNAASDNESSGSSKNAALVAALAALRSPLPPSALSVAGASYHRALAAAKSDAGWTSFVATASWWLGEKANMLCGEKSGNELKSVVLAACPPPGDSEADSTDDEMDGDDLSDDAVADSEKRNQKALLLDSKSIINAHMDRNPSLSVVISALNDVILSGNWQLRASAARAIGKIAIRSGEPYRLQCYGILVSLSAGTRGQDPLGLHGVVKSSINALDQIYGSQAIIDNLWDTYGDDIDDWPDEIVESVFKRSEHIRDVIEKTVCSLPKSQFNALGLRAMKICNQYQGEEEPVTMQEGDVTGSAIKSTKNKEIEDILSFGGTDDSFGFSNKFDKRLSKNDHLESLLMREDSMNATWENLADGRGHLDNDFTNNNGDGSDFSPKSAGTPSRSRRSSTERHAHSQGTMIHTFIAAPDHPEELSIFEGDVVEVLDLGQEGWALVRDPSGHQGLVPRSYVDIDSPVSPGKRDIYDTKGTPVIEADFISSIPSTRMPQEDIFSSSEAQGMPFGEPWEQPSNSFGKSNLESEDGGSKSPIMRGNSTSNPFENPRTFTPSHRRSASGLSDILHSPKTQHASDQIIVIPFESELEGELTVAKGDVVRVVSDAGGWSKVVRLSDEQTGLVPSWAVGSKS